MAEERSLITDEMRAWIGREFAPRQSEVVTARDIRRFCQSIANYNPLYVDEEYAKKGPYGGIIAPPFFLGISGQDADEPELREDGTPMGGAGESIPMPAELPRRMAGGSDYEFFQPVRPGDVITSRSKVVDIYERQGRTGRLVFGVTETTYTNQKGELVAKLRSTLIAR